MEFTTAQGQQDLFDYVHRPRRTIVEILTDFADTAARIPHEYIFDILSPLQPRSFSIASSQMTSPSEAHLLVAVVHYKSKRLVKPRRGVCSTWLASRDVTQDVTVPVWVKRGTIAFPDDERPVIMVGPGTGVAPFRSFIQERIARGIGGNILFFGSRNKHSDFFFEREWQKYTDLGLLTVITAFSRDQEDKVYVQHRIPEHSALVWKLIHEHNASFFIAGSLNNSSIFCA